MFTCVPGIVAAGPWENGVEGREQVEERPGQDDDVVCHHAKAYHLNAIAYTFYQIYIIRCNWCKINQLILLAVCLICSHSKNTFQ